MWFQCCGFGVFQMDLMPFVNKAGCECLNESDDCGFENCLNKEPSYLESDCDEQVSAAERNLPPTSNCLLFIVIDNASPNCTFQLLKDLNGYF